MKILVVGGSSDLGKEIVRTCLRNGHDVASTCHSNRVDDNDILLDVRDEESIQRAVAEAHEKMGCIEGVVYCSAIDRPAFVAKANIQDWIDVLDVNLLGAVRITKAVLPLFLRGDGGTFQFISSGLASRSNFGATSYAASKAALNALAKGISRENGQHNVRAFTVMPGFIDGGLIRNVTERDRSRIATFLDLKRIAANAEIASFCVATLENSSYLTSCNLEINGGMA